MKRLWTVIGGVSGWLLGGPIGAIIGVALGELVTQANTEPDSPYNTDPRTGRRNQGGPTSHSRPRPENTRPGDFHISLLILSAVVIKADGRIDQRELDYVRMRFVQLFGKEKANSSFTIFKKIVAQNIDLPKVAAQIRRNMAHSGRLQLLHFLFGVAGADGHVHPKEIEAIRRISRELYINDADFRSIQATYHSASNLDNAYAMLEIESTVSNDEVKKAYRRMAKRYHPDKLQHLGDDVQKAGEKKFVKIQEAYEAICKKRGI